MAHSFKVYPAQPLESNSLVFHQNSTFTGLAYCYVSGYDKNGNLKVTSGYLANATQGTDIVTPQQYPEVQNLHSFVQTRLPNNAALVAWCNQLNGELTNQTEKSEWVIRNSATTVTLSTLTTSFTTGPLTYEFTGTGPLPTDAFDNYFKTATVIGGAFSGTAPAQLTPFFATPITKPPTQGLKSSANKGGSSTSKARIAALTVTALTLGFFYTLSA
ncbi:hypothetical protein OC861_002066 [Tilletia horrida]|nr:hypothetical protein OC861_002066 [Tilletia horrida]